MRRRPARGIGLIELLAVAAITGSLAAMGAAGFSPLLDRLRLVAACGDFRSALVFARNEAIRRGRRVDLEPVSPAGWSAGWRVVADGGRTVIRSGPGLPASLAVSASLSDMSRAYLAFAPSGRPRTDKSASAPQFGSLTFRLGDQRRKIIINFLGRARQCDPDRDRTTC
ncbi:MAG: GspH/FimT family pseudopilin [Burkholderiaceae bacterium]|nr:GspH/FimT family pseudopilin [Burkholderiaceae bacterium]